jgi:hypothetical protein
LKKVKRLKMSGMKGVCPKCGAIYAGWALNNPKEQICGHCGSGLEIFRDGLSVGISYSPFTAPKYEILKSTKVNGRRSS